MGMADRFRLDPRPPQSEGCHAPPREPEQLLGHEDQILLCKSRVLEIGGFSGKKKQAGRGSSGLFYNE
jgi:hypothetical protein